MNESKASTSGQFYTYQEKDKYGVSANPEKDKPEEENPHKLIPFKCAICGLNEVAHYYGRKPAFARGTVEFVEDTYVMLDPFTPREKGRPNFLTLGGKCRYCENDVCLDCSIFYAKRTCRECALIHFDDLPDEIQVSISKTFQHDNSSMKMFIYRPS
jgi:hypothetical protein